MSDKLPTIEAAAYVGLSRPQFDRVAKERKLKKIRFVGDKRVFYYLKDLETIKAERAANYDIFPNPSAA